MSTCDTRGKMLPLLKAIALLFLLLLTLLADDHLVRCKPTINRLVYVGDSYVDDTHRLLITESANQKIPTLKEMAILMRGSSLVWEWRCCMEFFYCGDTLAFLLATNFN